MGKRVLYTAPGGDLRILSPSPGARLVTEVTFAGLGLTLTSLSPRELRAFCRLASAGYADVTSFVGEDDTTWTQRLTESHLAKRGLGGTPYETVDASVIPADRYFREAWERSGATVVVNLVKARLFRKKELEALRRAKLALADFFFNRADDEGLVVKKAFWKNRRISLRTLEGTMQGLLDAITDPKVLKSYVPPEMNFGEGDF